MKTKPSILYIADYPNWAFHNIYRSISIRLKYYFEFEIYFTTLKQNYNNELKLKKVYDLVWLCYPSDKTYLKLTKKPSLLIKEVASWRWLERHNNVKDFFSAELFDADIIACPSLELYEEIIKETTNVVYLPNGVESGFFSNKRERKDIKASDAIFGWVGNPNDPLKNFKEIVELQKKGFQIKIANKLNSFELVNFYKSIDALLITSHSESQPLPLLEALASGCYIFSRNVGIVSEILNDMGLNKIGKIIDWPSKFEQVLAESKLYCLQNERLRIVHINDWDNLIITQYSFFNALFTGKLDFKLYSSRYQSIDSSNIKFKINRLYYKIILMRDLIRYGKRNN